VPDSHDADIILNNDGTVGIVNNRIKDSVNHLYNYGADISGILNALSISNHTLGYKYLKKAIKMLVVDYSLTNFIRKDVYMVVADTFLTKLRKVEYNMRFVIEKYWCKGNIDLKKEIFRSALTEECPTISNFLCYVARYLRIKYGKSNYYIAGGMKVISKTQKVKVYFDSKNIVITSNELDANIIITERLTVEYSSSCSTVNNLYSISSIEEYLLKNNIDPTVSGYGYLIMAIKIVSEKILNREKYFLFKDVYPLIEKGNYISINNIARAIKRAIYNSDAKVKNSKIFMENYIRYSIKN
jgi:two-component system response regulator (stage 0 sporulation protein A)